MPHLFDPIKIREVVFRNRIGVSPMCQYSYTQGFSNDWQVVHLGARAAGGAGVVIAEATAVEPIGRISPNDVGIWTDDHIEPLQKVTKFLLSQGAVAGVQLAHAGRKACTHRPWEGGKPLDSQDPAWWKAVGPSPIPINPEYQTPKELTITEIKKIQLKFKEAAYRSLQAGFNLVEIHAAHGYLLHSFYSLLSNHRSDEYGGSFENRSRFLIETVREVRKVWPDRLPLFVRLSGTEWVEDGWSIEDSVNLARILIKEGVDLIDCSSGGNVSGVKIPLVPGYQVPIAEQVRKNSEMMTAAVGLITEPEHANQIIQEGKADMVLLGREMLRHPSWAIDAAKKLSYQNDIPSQYLRAYK